MRVGYIQALRAGEWMRCDYRISIDLHLKTQESFHTKPPRLAALILAAQFSCDHHKSTQITAKVSFRSKTKITNKFDFFFRSFFSFLRKTFPSLFLFVCWTGELMNKKCCYLITAINVLFKMKSFWKLVFFFPVVRPKCFIVVSSR